MIKPKTVALETLGCKLNQAETQTLADQFTRAGFQIVDPSQPADVWILNTCSVTHIADRKSRHLLRLARKQNPSALLVATGCYVERVPADLAKIGDVDLLADNHDKLRLVEIISNMLGTSCPVSTSGLTGPGCEGFKTRAMVKIQDGCNDFCTYCVVPFVRGKESSLSPDDIIGQIRNKVDAGYKEIVITGTKLGAYQSEDIRLHRLLERILTETPVTRLRLSSLQPADLTPDFLSLWKDTRMCPHLHMPLQSGSPSVLRRMKRQYTTSNFSKAVSLARQLIPDLAVTTDIIVGFPGESSEEFEESYRFCEQMAFAAIHVFPYSKRPGTRAADISDAIPAQIKKERSAGMLKLSRNATEHFHRQFLGKVIEVLWEDKEDNFWQGLTGNYIRVKASNESYMGNCLKSVRLTGLCKGGTRGEFI